MRQSNLLLMTNTKYVSVNIPLPLFESLFQFDPKNDTNTSELLLQLKELLINPSVSPLPFPISKLPQHYIIPVTPKTILFERSLVAEESELLPFQNASSNAVDMDHVSELARSLEFFHWIGSLKVQWISRSLDEFKCTFYFLLIENQKEWLVYGRRRLPPNRVHC
jgi:hypothetical protein